MTNPVEENTATKTEYGNELSNTYFPYVDNKQHWDIDYNDTNHSYEGSALPAWVLAGFAVYVLWSIIYLIIALS